MAWISNARLAAAVSEAGGMGIISAGVAEPETVRNEIRRAKELTQKPFGVNIMLLSPYADVIAELIVSEGVRVVTTGAGSPAKYMKQWKAAGMVVIPVVASVTQAKMMEKNGADAIIAEGSEAGGHVGETTTMCLVPQVVDAVSIPVIAAGGIADRRGIAAATALGAVGVQIGTRFLVAKECEIHPTYKKMVLDAKDSGTMVTGKRPGLHPVRSLKTPMSRTFFQKEFDPNTSTDELEEMGRGAYRRAVVEGDTENGCFLCGQIAGLVTKEQTCQEIIDELFTETSSVKNSPAKPATINEGYI